MKSQKKPFFDPFSLLFSSNCNLFFSSNLSFDFSSFCLRSIHQPSVHCSMVGAVNNTVPFALRLYSRVPIIRPHPPLPPSLSPSPSHCIMSVLLPPKLHNCSWLSSCDEDSERVLSGLDELLLQLRATPQLMGQTIKSLR